MDNPSLIPIGTIVIFQVYEDYCTKIFSDDGWLTCDGRYILKQDYPELYKIVKGKFSETRNAFALPNYEGNFPVFESEFEKLMKQILEEEEEERNNG